MSREMKDSGVEWIGEIPENWGVTRLKYAYDNSNGSAVRVGPFGSALPSSDYISDGEWVYNQRTVLDENFTTNNTCVSKEKADSLSGFRVYPGDILITTRGTLGHIAVVPNGAPSGILHPCIIRFRVDLSIVMPELLKYMFNDSDFFIKQIEFANNSTTIEALYSYNLRDLILPEIPITEQSQIVHFLNRKCTVIDTVIEKTKKSLEKLEEYKKAVITKAVTKGIDPNAKMKDSGVEWIGEIPERWKVTKTKYLFRILKRIAGCEGFDVISITQKGLKIKDITSNEGQVAENYSNYQFVFPGDFAMNHMDLLTGWVDLSSLTGVTSPDYRVFHKINESVNDDYYKYVFQSLYFNKVYYGLAQGVAEVGRKRLQAPAFKELKLPCPPADEPAKIAAYIKNKCMAIDALIEKKQTAINKWEEYKKSLIYYAVTGKYDCRNEVI